MSKTLDNFSGDDMKVFFVMEMFAIGYEEK